MLLLGILLELLSIISYHVSYAFYGCKGASCISIDCCRGQAVSLLTVVVD